MMGLLLSLRAKNDYDLSSEQKMDRFISALLLQTPTAKIK